METKNEKFVRLSGQRKEKSIGFINSLKKLMAPTYESNVVERQAIVDDLYASVNDLADEFGLETGIPPVVNNSDESSEAIKYLDSITEKAVAPITIVSVPDEDEHLMGIAPTIDEAINLIADGSPAEARMLLIKLLAT